MSLAEIVHRVFEQAYIFKFKLQYVFLKSSFYKQYTIKEFSFCSSLDAKLPELDWDFQPNQLEIKQFLSGSWPVLGFSWKWNKDNNCWHSSLDKSGQWPQTFFNSINYRSGNPYGDVRVMWEPARLQQLISVAFLCNSKESDVSQGAVKLLEAQLDDWVKSNYFLQGIHYISSMECALRIISISVAVDTARQCLSHESSVWNNVLNIVNTHACLIEKRLSLHSSCGNHTIAEATGLLYAGILFPEFKRARHWRKTGEQILSEEANRQILPDGGPIEQTFWYLLFICDLFGLADSLLSKYNARNKNIHNAFGRGRKFISSFADQPLNLPNIGDRDDGYALSKHLRISFSSIPGPELRCEVFKNCGYTLCKPRTDIKLIFDHGSLGMSPSYGHGHSDCLSLIVIKNGKEIITDSGTYGYAVSDEWRKYFRSANAHNTVTVDGQDQADYVNGFMWKSPFVAELVSHDEMQTSLSLLAKHNGYEHIDVTHWRGLFVDYENGCFVWDKLTGSGNHNLTLQWHVASPMQRDKHSFQIINADMNLDVLNATSCDVHQGDLNNINGWQSQRYGEKAPINTILSNYEDILPHEFHTFISWGSSKKLKTNIDAVVENFRKLINES